MHGLYQDRYAHRDTMTDVIIQHLITEQKVRIKTRDYVKKIAVYKARLAIQLPDRVLIYETSVDDAFDMHYKLREKVVRQLDCNLLVVTSQHLILCMERKLQLFNFKGKKVREWLLEAVIRYIRVVGGPTGREGLLIGLKNGCVYKIFIDNRFPVRLVQHSSPIRCLDLSSSRRRLAVVDESSRVYVYDLSSQAVQFEAANANSVAWNTEMEDMLCYSGGGQLSIKTGSFPLHTQSLQGFVVGFKGSKVFCLHFLTMQTIDVPQSASLYRYLELRDFERAYQVACLGVTEADWRELAVHALQQLQFPIARQAFIRIRDVRYIELLNKLDVQRRNPGADHSRDEAVFVADIAAFQGQFADAARAYLKAGLRRRAIEMFLDLRDWQKAKEAIEQAALDSADAAGDDGFTILDLLKRQANWLLETGDNVGAAELFWASRDFGTSIAVLAQFGLHERLLVKMRELDVKRDRKHLQQIAQHFRRQQQAAALKETLLRLDEFEQVVALLCEQGQWAEARRLIEQQPRAAAGFWLPYADYLASVDQYEQAQDAYRMAGQPLQSMRMLHTLIANALTERRHADCAHFHHLLGMEALKALHEQQPPGEQSWAALFSRHRQLSCVYYAYHLIHRYTEEPFTSLHPDALFQTAQFVLQRTHGVCPPGVSRVNCLYALAKQAKQLGAWKLARSAYSQLLALRMSPAWRAEVEQEALRVRVRPFTDSEELLPVCYRCSTSNPLMPASSAQQADSAQHSDRCINCGHEFMRSFCSFECLPLVRFVLPPGLTDGEAEKLIELDWQPVRPAADRLEVADGAQSLTLTLGGDADAEGAGGDGQADMLSFHEQLLHYEPGEDGRYGDMVADAEALKRMRRAEVFIRRWGSAGGSSSSDPTCPRNEYYISVIPEVKVTMCSACQQFFHEEDYDFYVLQHRHCPFCRTPVPLGNAEAGEENGDTRR